MILKPTVRLFSRKGLKQVVFTAFAYWFFLVLTDYTLEKLPWLQFRFATFIPVVCGILFGLPGAIGSGIANILIDLGTETKPLVSLGAAVLNCFLAYLPFRLWYGLKNAAPLRLIYDSTSFARFIFIALLNGFIFAASLTALIDIFYGNTISENFSFFFVLLSNNYIFPILLGLPLLIYWRKKYPVLYYPPFQGQSCRYGGRQLPVLFLLCSVDILYLILLSSDMLPASSSAVIFAINLVLLSYICTLPSQCQPNQVDADYSSLTSKTSALLLLFISANIVLGLIAMLLLRGHGINGSRMVKEWSDFYVILSSVINISFVFFWFLLRWVEKTISNPLFALSLRAQHYMETGIDKMATTEPGPATNEVEVLNQAFGCMSSDLSRYIEELTKATEAKHYLKSQLDVANQIQQGTLPKLDEVNAVLQHHNSPYHVEGLMRSAKGVGGNMFDCYLIDENHLLLNVGDAAGEGIPAALFSMVAQALISNAAYDKGDAVTNLSSIVEKVNDALEENNRGILCVTLWVGIIELSTGKIIYVNAAHPPSLIASLDGRGTVKLLDKVSGTFLGILSNVIYTSYTDTLEPGQKLLILTNGLNEAENEAGECFSSERLQEAFLNARRPQDIMQKIAEFVGNAPQSDDMTYLWVERY